MKKVSSRERLLAAIDHAEVDPTPLCFFLFKALWDRCRDHYEFIERQVQLGADVKIGLPNLPRRFDPEVKTKVWSEKVDSEVILHKVYETPKGDLEAIVGKTADWPHGEDIPLCSDYNIPRSKKFLITSSEDLPKLKFLFSEPTKEEIEKTNQQSKTVKNFAAKEGLLTELWTGLRLGDNTCHLCGAERFALSGLSEPDFLEEFLGILAEWDKNLLEILLENRPDIYVKTSMV